MMRFEQVALAFLTLLLATPAFAQSSETGGIGGTGISHETGGIGGTGIARHGTPVLSYGPIQAFGSVFVNGREFRVDNHTLVLVDGRPATVAALRVGNIARVRGTITGARSGFARSISVTHPVIGPVASISDGGHRAVVLGQTLVASARPVFARFKPGEIIAVSAQLRADGRWMVGNARLEPDARAQLLGPVSLRNGKLFLAGTPVALQPGLAEPAAGSQALAIGTAEHGELIAHSITPGPSLIAPTGTRIEASDYFVGGNGTVRAPDGLEVENLPDSDKLSGLDLVRVEGNLVAPDLVELDKMDDILNRPAVPTVSEPAENVEPEIAPDEVTPDELTPEVPNEPPEYPDLDDK